MSNVNVIKCVDALLALSTASANLNSILKKLRDDVPVLLLMSGGSALQIAEHIEKNVLPKDFTLGVLDDRYSTDPAVNNFTQLSKTKLYIDALESNADFIDTRVVGGESLEEVGDRFGRALKSWRERNPNGKIIITQGIGPDGHTSGVMPYGEDKERFQKLFVDPDRFAVGYDAEGKNQYSLRITVTLRFLIDQVEESVLFMTGADKKNAFRNVFDSAKTLAETPGRVIHQMKKVNIFTDLN